MSTETDKNLTQPAQAVDVGAIRDVIASIRVANVLGADASSKACNEWEQALTRALAGEQAGWRVPDAIVDLDECRKAGWYDSAPAYRAGWNAYRSTMLDFPASPTPDKETQR